jgi:hypothetical protein
METACDSAQLLLITKGQKYSSGTLRFTTSIWAVGNDGETAVQQRCETAETLPLYADSHST